MWRPTVSSDELYHSRGPWKKHKYTAIKNGRYIYPGESVEDAARNYRRAAKTAAREQEKGIRKTKQANKHLEEDRKYANRANSPRYTDRLENARRNAINRNDSKSARKLLKQKKIAESVYEQGSRAAVGEVNAKNSARRHTAMVNSLSLKQQKKYEPKNPTARKNQRRAKLESLIFKGKKKVKKALSKLSVKQKVNDYLEELRKPNVYTAVAKIKTKEALNKAVNSVKTAPAKARRNAAVAGIKGKSKVRRFLKNVKKRSEPRVTVTSNLMPAGTKKDITKKYKKMTSKKKR